MGTAAEYTEFLGTDLLNVAGDGAREFGSSHGGLENNLWVAGKDSLLLEPPIEFRLAEDAWASMTVEHLLNSEENGVIDVLVEGDVEIARGLDPVDGQHPVELLETQGEKVPTFRAGARRINGACPLGAQRIGELLFGEGADLLETISDASFTSLLQLKRPLK